MAAKLIVDYKAAWQINSNKNGIKIKTDGAKSFENVKIDKASEFVAILTMLQGSSPVFYDKSKTVFSIK